jgi:hypothetical protein
VARRRWQTGREDRRGGGRAETESFSTSVSRSPPAVLSGADRIDIV